MGAPQVAHGRVAVSMVVLGLEVADDHAGLEQGVPVFAVEALLPESVVERFDVNVVLRTPRRDVRHAGLVTTSSKRNAVRARRNPWHGCLVAWARSKAAFRRLDHGLSALLQAAVGGAGHPNGLARQSFRHAQGVLKHVDGAALVSWAQNVPFATSRTASFSSSPSASSRLGRAFCSSSSLSYFAASVSIPP